MTANKKALGRNHYTADSASMTDFGDCCRVNLRWVDGAEVYTIHDTKEQAIAYLNQHGFTK
jgi:hypothetical protein